MSRVAPMTVESIDAFFDALAARRHVPALDRVTATLEFDIEGTDRRWMTISRGDLVITRIPTKADCILACDSATFLRIISGKQNVIAATIRGDVKVAGDLALALSIQRAVSDVDG